MEELRGFDILSMFCRDFKIDTFLKQGYSHYICEDYITARHSGIVVLSDGCSSSPDTDIGSRLLCLSSASFLDEESEISHIYNKYKDILTGTPDTKNSLDATFASLTPEGFVYFFGDGYIFYKLTESEDIHIISIDYPSGAPYYLSYLLDRSRSECYLNNFSNKKIVTYSDGTVVEEEATKPVDLWMDTRENKYEFIGIASDGLGSFQQDGKEPVPVKEVIEKICAFKSFNGEFLKRRMNKVFKEYSKEDIEHYDDISIGIIKFGE